MKRTVAALAALSIGGALGCAGLLDQIAAHTSPATGGGLDERTVADGLREALRVGSERAVALTSKTDGFFANELIRIAMPNDLRKMASALRKIGLGREVDKLELAMNRAAESASGEAKEVFWDAIRSLTIEDAFAILRGGDTAATDLLRQRTGDRLRARFAPIVSAKMQEVGLARLYGDLADRYAKLPLVTRPAVDLEAYVTDRALDGLFTMLAGEERRIREDPVARTTELLKRVFG